MGVSQERLAGEYTYADLEAFPEDNVRREIIDGELIVHPSPATRHQRAARNVFVRLWEYSLESGGEAFFAPLDVYFAEKNVVEPDVLFMRRDHLDRIGPNNLQGPPDLVVEISSPSTRHLDQVRKRELYQRFGVPHYWFVDLEAERVELYDLRDGAYPAPMIRYAGQVMDCDGLPGLAVSVAEALPEE